MKKAPRTQQARSEATRGELLSAAGELFGSRGYAATQIEDIVRKIRATRGALYHHFPGKAAVFRSVFEEREKTLVAIVTGAAAKAKDARDALRRGCHAFLEAFLDPALQRIVLLDGPAVLGWETWREIDSDHGHALLKESLEAAFAEARARPPHDASITAHLLLALLNESALLIAGAADPGAALKIVRREVDAWLGARIGLV